MKSLVTTALKEIMNNLQNYPEITIIFPNNSKPSENVLDMTIEGIGRHGRRENCNVSIIIKENALPAKTIFANLSNKVMLGK